MNTALRRIAGSVICLALLNGHAETLMDILESGSTVRHADFPFYSKPDRSLSTVLHVERAYLDYQRKGFFRIGLLPVGALEGVTIEIRDPRYAPDSFRQMQRWLGGGGGRRTELRQVKFLFSTNSLEAGRVQCRADDHWDLLDGVRLVSGGIETRAPRGPLHLSGQDAGKVVLEDTDIVTNMFLGARSGTER